MKLIAFAVAGLVVAGAGAASAQPMWGPDQGRFYGPERAPTWERDGAFRGEQVTPQQLAYILDSMGLDPVGPPLRSGPLFIQRASDDYGRIVRVTINAQSGRVVSVAPAGAPPVVNGGPYAVSRPYGPGPYARTAPDDDDVEFAPPGSVMAPRAALPQGPVPPATVPRGALAPRVDQPPRSAAVTPSSPSQSDTARPASKAAIATPSHPPVPRKRPENAQAAAKKSEPGSVAPLQATPTPAPAAPASTTAPADSNAAPGNAMPPVAPLE